MLHSFLLEENVELKNALIEESLYHFQRILSADVSVGHNYNLVDVRSRRILNVETASRNRYAAHEAGPDHFFHANMYIHLQIQQVEHTQQRYVHNMMN